MLLQYTESSVSGTYNCNDAEQSWRIVFAALQVMFCGGEGKEKLTAAKADLQRQEKAVTEHQEHLHAARETVNAKLQALLKSSRKDPMKVYSDVQ